MLSKAEHWEIVAFSRILKFFSGLVFLVKFKVVKNRTSSRHGLENRFLPLGSKNQYLNRKMILLWQFPNQYACN